MSCKQSAEEDVHKCTNATDKIFDLCGDQILHRPCSAGRYNIMCNDHCREIRQVYHHCKMSITLRQRQSHIPLTPALPRRKHSTMSDFKGLLVLVSLTIVRPKGNFGIFHSFNFWLQHLGDNKDYGFRFRPSRRG